MWSALGWIAVGIVLTLVVEWIILWWIAQEEIDKNRAWNARRKTPSAPAEG
jgi:hypothetical protein